MKKIIKFYADRCGPCKMITPAIKEIASEMNFELEEINVDDKENSKIVSKYQVRSLPTVIFVSGDDETTVVGARTKEDYILALQ